MSKSGECFKFKNYEKKKLPFIIYSLATGKIEIKEYILSEY